MLKIARRVMYAVLPAELLIVVLLVLGVAIPTPVLVAAESVVAAVLVLEAVTFWRLFIEERRSGLGGGAAARAAARRLVPTPVRRIMSFDVKSMASLGLWVLRRRDGVPPGATAVPYAAEQIPMQLVLVFALALETVAVEVLLRALGAPDALRIVMLVLDLYGVLFCLMVMAACVTHPHVVTERELRIRYGVYFDLRIPRDSIVAVRQVRNLGESGTVSVRDGRLAVVVDSQTNVVVELAEPVVAVRPLGAEAEVTEVRFFASDPASAVAALRDAVERRPAQEVSAQD